jgi:hypothetical protein
VVIVPLLALVLTVALPAAVVFWARRLRKRQEIAPAVAWMAYAFVALDGLLTVGFPLMTASRAISSFGAVSGESVDPSQKARVLAEGISEGMNCGVLGLACALGGIGWLLFWRWYRKHSG